MAAARRSSCACSSRHVTKFLEHTFHWDLKSTVCFALPKTKIFEIFSWAPLSSHSLHYHVLNISRPTIRPPDFFIEMKVHVCEMCSGCLHVSIAGCRNVILRKVKSRTATLVRRASSTMLTAARARNYPPTFSSKSTAPNCTAFFFYFFFSA